MADKNIKLRVSETGADKTSRSLGNVDNRLKSLAKSAAGVGLAYFGATGIINAFKGSIDAAARQELAERKLQTALGRTSKALLEQASALQRVTTVGDEAIIEQQAFLASLKFTESQIKDIITASIDLSAATGISLESAVRNTAKTFSGLAGELGELIPQLRDLTQEEMKAGDAVKVIADLFGGQAKAQTETLTGSIEQMKNALGDAGEAIGILISGPVIAFVGLLKNVAEGINAVVSDATKLKDAIFKNNEETEKQNLSLKEQLELRRQELTALVGAKSQYKSTQDVLRGRSKQERQIIIDLFQQINTLKSQLKTEEDLAKIKAAREQQEAVALARKQAMNDTMREEVELLGDIEKTEEEIAFERKQRIEAEIALENKKKILKEQQIQSELRQAALVQGSAMDAMKAVVRAESMEAVAGLIASILKSVPFPFNTILAAGAGATAAGLIDKGLAQFATGGDFITDGPQMIMVGDNAGGRERVQVTPLSSPNINGPQQGISVNFNAPVTNDEYVRDFIIPEIKKATRMNLA